MNNFKKEIRIIIKKNEIEDEWSKDGTIKEIEEHRLKSGKQGKAIIKKTMDRGKKFMEERYLVRDSVYVKESKRNFTIKASCKASTKREIRKMTVILK